MKKLLGLVSAIGFLALVCQGATFRPLPLESQANIGATHVAVITYADLAGSATNSCVVTNTATAAEQGYELVAMMLKTAFVDTATNAHNSTTMTVGDGDDAALYLNTTELNSNGTEVFLKFPRAERTFTTTSVTRTNMTGVAINTATLNYAATNAPTVTIATLGVTLTNMVWDAGATTGTVYVITNVTATATLTAGTLAVGTNVTATTAAQASLTAASDAATDYGRKLYTAAGVIKCTFAGTLPYKMSDLDAGEVRLYFRVKDAAGSIP